MTSIDAVYRRIGELVALDYAAIGAGLGKKKPPVCKKGWPCGYSCQPRTKKNCKSGLSGQAKTYADWLGKQAGGAIVVASKSGLQKQGGAPEAAKTKSDPFKNGPRPGEVEDAIDRKYAKAKPTEEDIDGWLKERLDRAVTAEGMAVADTMRQVFPLKEFTPGYAKGADTRETVVNAVTRYRHEKLQDYKKAGKINADTYGGPSLEQIRKAEERVNSPKVKNKAKAQKEVDRLKDQRAASQRVADREMERANMTFDELRKVFDGGFSDTEKSFAKVAQKVQQQIKKGDVLTIQDETEKILRKLDQYRPQDEEDMTVLGTRSRQREIAKEYLIAKSKDRRPEEVLQIQGDLTPANIKTAYRKAALESHPDQGGSREEFEKVNEAYKKLQEQLGFSEPTLGLDDDEDVEDEDLWQS